MGIGCRRYKMVAKFVVVALAAVSAVQAEPVSICRPTKERYFIADTVQCDRFHMCDEDGKLAAEFLCQDGLVYEPISKQCGLPFKIDCVNTGRTLLQEPQPQGNCQRLNGKWPVPDTCDQYIDCTSGVERLVTCRITWYMMTSLVSVNILILLTELAALLKNCMDLLVPILLVRPDMLLIPTVGLSLHAEYSPPIILD